MSTKKNNRIYSAAAGTLALLAVATALGISPAQRANAQDFDLRQAEHQGMHTHAADLQAQTPPSTSTTGSICMKPNDPPLPLISGDAKQAMVTCTKGGFTATATYKDGTTSGPITITPGRPHTFLSKGKKNPLVGLVVSVAVNENEACGSATIISAH